MADENLQKIQQMDAQLRGGMSPQDAQQFRGFSAFFGQNAQPTAAAPPQPAQAPHISPEEAAARRQRHVAAIVEQNLRHIHEGIQAKMHYHPVITSVSPEMGWIPAGYLAGKGFDIARRPEGLAVGVPYRTLTPIEARYLGLPDPTQSPPPSALPGEEP